jgi:hypothetical protein
VLCFDRTNNGIAIRDVASDRFDANEELTAEWHHHVRVTQAGTAIEHNRDSSGFAFFLFAPRWIMPYGYA